MGVALTRGVLWSSLTGLLFGAAAMGEVCLVLQRRERRAAHALRDLATRALVTALDSLGRDATISANDGLAQQVQCCRGIAASLVGGDKVA